jgi:hypothetical protein
VWIVCIYCDFQTQLFTKIYLETCSITIIYYPKQYVGTKVVIHIKYVRSCYFHQTVGQNINVQIGNTLFEYLGTTLANQNFIDEIKSRWKSGNA